MTDDEMDGLFRTIAQHLPLDRYGKIRGALIVLASGGLSKTVRARAQAVLKDWLNECCPPEAFQ